jgi:sugar transferase (PEP-CTERM system associated)
MQDRPSMIARIFRPGISVSAATVFQVAVEVMWLFAAGALPILLFPQPARNAAMPALAFATMMLLMNVGFGLYRTNERLSSATYLLRVLLASLMAFPLFYVLAGLFPQGKILQQHLAATIVVALGGLLLLRHIIVLPLINGLLPRRILVLGAGSDARLIETSLAASTPRGIELAGFYALEKEQERAVSSNLVLTTSASLGQTVRRLDIDEVIVAVRQQRGDVLPMQALLECRLDGIKITDLAGFFERVHRLLPVESLKMSSLIYGNGFRQGFLRTFVKRTFDLVVSTILILISFPIMIVVGTLIALEGNGPIIYRQERVGCRGSRFTLLKFRSMTTNAEQDGKASWAAADDVRTTRIGRVLRRTRLDELPQLVNVFAGQMSIVGPRPERPEFVEMLTEKIPFYAARHTVKPGLTGWAQVRYSYGATVEQAVKKLEYDLYYVKNNSLFLDLIILLETVGVVALREGAR